MNGSHYKTGVKSAPIWHGPARYHSYFKQLDGSCHFMMAKSKMGEFHRSLEINHERRSDHINSKRSCSSQGDQAPKGGANSA